jgi:hypothetical protein
MVRPITALLRRGREVRSAFLVFLCYGIGQGYAGSRPEEVN